MIDAVWSCIVGSAKNEQRFIDQDGLFQLLEVLEVRALRGASQLGRGLRNQK